MNTMPAQWLLFSFLTLVSSIILDPRDVNAPFLACYDYIICGEATYAKLHIYQFLGCRNVTDASPGGGVSGLVLANRLTEDPNGTSPIFFFQSDDLFFIVSVLVLEAGSLQVLLRQLKS